MVPFVMAYAVTAAPLAGPFETVPLTVPLVVGGATGLEELELPQASRATAKTTNPAAPRMR
jgi:hypothetical protein